MQSIRQSLYESLLYFSGSKNDSKYISNYTKWTALKSQSDDRFSDYTVIQKRPRSKARYL